MDQWAAPVREPMASPTYRGRANYRSGTAAVGKRMTTGAVKGVGKPKQLAPTRTAARTVGRDDMSKPPIPASEVGKGLRPGVNVKRYTQLAMRGKNAKQAKANEARAAVLHGRPSDFDLPYRSPDRIGKTFSEIEKALMRQGAKDALAAVGRQKGIAKPGSVAALTESSRVSQARKRGVLVPLRRKGATPPGTAVGKRARRYDAEDRRQRRLGAAVAGTGIGGGALTASGAQTVRRHTRDLASLPMDLSKRPGFSTEAREAYAVVRNRKGVIVSGQAARKLGAGAGLLGVSAGLAHHGRSRANRRWS